MNMISHREAFPTQENFNKALQAIEAQRAQRIETENDEIKLKRERLFKTLDRSSHMIFAGIEKSSKDGQSIFFLGEIPGLRDDFDLLFGLGYGAFDPVLFQDWLLARNLSKHFHVDGQRAIAW